MGYFWSYLVGRFEIRTSLPGSIQEFLALSPVVGRPVIEELAAITVLVIFLDDKKKTCVNCGSKKSQDLKKNCND